MRVRAQPDASGRQALRGYALVVFEPEMRRRARQHGADIDALYELVAGVDRKVDALDAKVDRRSGEITGQLAEFLRRLGS